MATKKKVVKATKKVKRNIILPMKMSSLIKIALADIRKAEKSEKCIIDMGYWYDFKEVKCYLEDSEFGGVPVSTTEACVVCASGSVMAFSLGALENKEKRHLIPSSFRDNEQQLTALDYLRQGMTSTAAEYLRLFDWDTEDGVKRSEKLRKLDAVIPEYTRENPEPFHKAMEKYRLKLLKAGF